MSPSPYNESTNMGVVSAYSVGSQDSDLCHEEVAEVYDPTLQDLTSNSSNHEIPKEQVVQHLLELSLDMDDIVIDEGKCSSPSRYIN